MTRVAVVLAAVMDGYPNSEREGSLPVADRLAPEGAALVGRDAVVRVEPVKGLLGVADGVALKVGVGVGELGSQAGVVATVAGVQVAAEAAGDLVNRPVTELMTAVGGRGLQVLQQLPVADDGVAVGGWWAGWAGV
jgi:hypothetical protein